MIKVSLVGVLLGLEYERETWSAACHSLVFVGVFVGTSFVGCDGVDDYIG